LNLGLVSRIVKDGLTTIIVTPIDYTCSCVISIFYLMYLSWFAFFSLDFSTSVIEPLTPLLTDPSRTCPRTTRDMGTEIITNKINIVASIVATSYIEYKCALELR
jgi:hypothetical protein